MNSWPQESTIKWHQTVWICRAHTHKLEMIHHFEFSTLQTYPHVRTCASKTQMFHHLSAHAAFQGWIPQSILDKLCCVRIPRSCWSLLSFTAIASQKLYQNMTIYDQKDLTSKKHGQCGCFRFQFQKAWHEDTWGQLLARDSRKDGTTALCQNASPSLLVASEQPWQGTNSSPAIAVQHSGFWNSNSNCK